MDLDRAQTDRAAGALVGTATGDALGAGYEFGYPGPDTVIDMIGGGPFHFAPGEWTDDTSMTVAVAMVTATGRDLRTAEGLDGVVAGFLAWFNAGPKDVGSQTRLVLATRDRTAAGMTATAKAIPGRTAGNGSLMRTAAVGLAYLDDPDACVEAAQKVSDLTHADARAAQACQLWSLAIRHAVLHGSFDGVREYLRTADPEPAAFWGARLDEAEAPSATPDQFGNNGWVVHALQTAWWAITHAHDGAPSHLPDALDLAVRAGNDTDTTAAIAGSLLGARWGRSAIPQRWQSMLHGWPGLRTPDLVTLAEKTVLTRA
jgi:ADP-ribosylglycohydrolase